jgi:hypothetical protein
MFYSHHNEKPIPSPGGGIGAAFLLSRLCLSTMESLIARVLLLPVAVIGDHVLSFLSIPDMVRFDSAVAQKRYRRSVEEAFVCVTVQLKLARPHQAQYQRNIWRWCIKRAVTVAEVFFAELDAEEDVKLLLEILRRVPGDGIVGWHCMMRVVGTRVVRSTLSNSELKSRINRVDVVTVNFPAIPGLWEEQSSAQEELDVQEVEPEALSELQVGQADQGLPSILLGCKSMREIWLFRCAVLSLTTVEALCNHALVSLSLHATRKCTPELLSVIGNVCCNLRSLVIENGQGDEQWVTESGLISVARGCRKLASFAADYVDAVTERVLLVFAAHCPELDTLAWPSLGALPSLTQCCWLSARNALCFFCFHVVPGRSHQWVQSTLPNRFCLALYGFQSTVPLRLIPRQWSELWHY